MDKGSDLAAALRRETARPSVLVPLVDTWLKRLVLGLIALCSYSAVAYAWAWWLPLHLKTGSYGFLSIIFSAVILRETTDALLMQGLLFRAKVVNKEIKPPRFRVAMIATKVPAEPLSMLQKTLTAMLNQDYPYPYDVWLADERPDQETQDWCAENGVRISCRFGVPEYHRPVWPRRTRCKEGNLSYFYDNWGYDMYDIVAQFDADHVPTSTYLSTSLPAFLDPQVGYVACPSICGANADVSWAVRGRLYFEAYFHGALGASLSRNLMPFCIGSHYVVRTTHLKIAGGLGPELDEDMSTSYIMSANGFKGVFGLNTIAYGDGPATFEDSMHQEYQWARSAMLILTNYMWPWFGGRYQLSMLERLRVMHWMSFWLVQTFYVVASPLVTIGLANGYVRQLPGIEKPVDGYNWKDFSTAMSVVLASQIAVLVVTRQFGWLRPYRPPLISYEAELYRATRSFYIAIGTVHGLLGGLLGVHFDFKVTPKGNTGERMINNRNIAPILIQSAVFFAFSWLATGDGAFSTLVLLGVYNLSLAVFVIVLHYRENHKLSRLPYDNLFSLLVPIVLLTAAGSYSVALRGM